MQSFIYLITCSFNHLFIQLPLRLFICLFVCLFVYLVVYSYKGSFFVLSYLFSSQLLAGPYHTFCLSCAKSRTRDQSVFFTLSPDTVFVGPLLPKPPAPLSEDLKRFLSSSGKAGVVLVTFGSMMSSPPPEITEKLATALGRLKQKVIWRIDGKSYFFRVSITRF